MYLAIGLFLLKQLVASGETARWTHKMPHLIGQPQKLTNQTRQFMRPSGFFLLKPPAIGVKKWFPTTSFPSGFISGHQKAREELLGESRPSE
jgi:hypothetical protein